MSAWWLLGALAVGIVLGALAVPAYVIVQQLRGKGINL